MSILNSKILLESIIIYTFIVFKKSGNRNKLKYPVLEILIIFPSFYQCFLLKICLIIILGGNIDFIHYCNFLVS